MKTEELLSTTGETIEYAKIYVEQQVDYFRLETAKRLAKTTSNLTTVLVMAFLAMMVVVFLTLAVGLLLGSYWESYSLAFFVVTGFYFITTLFIFFFKKQIITNPILSIIIKEMLD